MQDEFAGEHLEEDSWDVSEWNTTFSAETRKDLGLSDPTVRIALKLGLDPLKLLLFFDDGRSINPKQAIDALQFALANPPTTSGVLQEESRLLLKGIKNTNAKRQYKAWSQPKVRIHSTIQQQVDRVVAIDAHIAAMMKRLKKVELDINQEIAATFDIFDQEGPIQPPNTHTSPTPIPGTSSATEELSAYPPISW